MGISCIIECHYSCSSCFGPSETHCITCPDEETTNRVYNPGQSSCGCRASYVENEITQCVSNEINITFRKPIILLRYYYFGK